MKEEITKLRVQIDGLAQLTKDLRPINESSPFRNRHELHLEGWINSKEIEKAVDSLYLAKAWLGKVLGELGEETPYKNDGNRKEVKDIEPTADKYSFNKIPLEDNSIKDYFSVTDIPSILWSEKSHIEKVDFLRQEIEKVIKEVKEIPVGENIKIIDVQGVLPERFEFKSFSREFAIARTNCYNHLSEARFWLGFELERLKNE